MTESVTKTCKHFGRCGGCQYLSVPYVEQLRHKAKWIRELFAEFPDTIIHKVVESPEPHGYRHKVQLPFGVVKEGPRTFLTMGCYAEGSHAVVDQHECHIQDPALTLVAHAVRAWANKEKLSPYDERTCEGVLRHVLLRRSLATGEILIGLVTNAEKPAGSRNLAKSLLAICEKALKKDPRRNTIVGIVQNVNERDTNVVLGNHHEVWWGRDWIKETLGAHTHRIELSTFFQINPYQTPRLYEAAASYLPEGVKCLDAYSGMGTIALWISGRCREVIGVEENPASVKAARLASMHQGVKNVRFLQGDTADVLPKLVNEGFEAAVVDPPRKGMDERTIQAILDSKLPRLVYVSCNPETLLRDAKLLAPHLTLRQITPVDMFPHTGHVECVALFTR
jgi:23S rRNA (uracil1939-C5)-methyltransferase